MSFLLSQKQWESTEFIKSGEFINHFNDCPVTTWGKTHLPHTTAATEVIKQIFKHNFSKSNKGVKVCDKSSDLFHCIEVAISGVRVKFSISNPAESFF